MPKREGPFNHRSGLRETFLPFPAAEAIFINSFFVSVRMVRATLSLFLVSSHATVEKYPHLGKQPSLLLSKYLAKVWLLRTFRWLRSVAATGVKPFRFSSLPLFFGAGAIFCFGNELRLSFFLPRRAKIVVAKNNRQPFSFRVESFFF